MVKTELNYVQAVALQKLADKAVADLKKKGETIDPGNYEFNFDLSVDGKLARGGDTEVAPTFRIESLFKAIILKYASTLNDPEGWLAAFLSTDGVLGAVIQLGPELVIKQLDENLKAVYDKSVSDAKDKWKATCKKVPRQGNTSVIGDMEIKE